MSHFSREICFNHGYLILRSPRGISGVSVHNSGGTTLKDIGTLGGWWSRAYDINDRGQIVGDSTNITGYVHAFLYGGSAMNDLGTLGGSSSYAWGINNSGQIVGMSTIAGDSAYHAFLYDGGNMIDIGTLGGTFATASAINERGQIVGTSTVAGDYHAFLYDGGNMIDLNCLLPKGSGWELTDASDINDLGQITGYGYINGATRGFVMPPELSPVPEPSTLALLGIGIAGITFFKRMHK